MSSPWPRPRLDGLPPAAKDLARRLGATGRDASMVRLSQSGTMRDSAQAPPRRFRAQQTIALDRPCFRWRATSGPFGCISILDELNDGVAGLSVSLFARIPLFRETGGGALLKGEAMRYLAELAWAPDAILQNESLGWRVLDGERLEVSVVTKDVRAAVEFALDSKGRLASVFAPDRPRKEKAGFVERPWRGRFFDYRRHGGRWLPFRAEVSWLTGGDEFVTWEGRIADWALENRQAPRR